MSACNVTTPGSGVIGCRSTAIMVIGSSGVDSGDKCRDRTCDQEPGAAQRSITLRTFFPGMLSLLLLGVWVAVPLTAVLVVGGVFTVGNRLNCSLSWSSLNAERAR